MHMIALRVRERLLQYANATMVRSSELLKVDDQGCEFVFRSALFIGAQLCFSFIVLLGLAHFPILQPGRTPKLLPDLSNTVLYFLFSEA